MSYSEAMSYWPQHIENVSKLPEKYIQAIEHHLGRTDVDNMYCVLAPALEILWFMWGGQLICIDGDKMHYFKPKASFMEYCCVKKSEVDYVRYKMSLLNSELQFHIYQDGEAKLLKTEYNSVKNELYDPVKGFVRGETRRHEDIQCERDNKFLYLIDKNFKLMNFSMQAYDYMPAICNLYQPPMRKKLKKTTGGILYILTENEFIVMEDNENYSILYNYIQREAINEVIITDIVNGWGKIVVSMRGRELSFPYSADNYDEIKTMIDNLK
jgi:hypothetical protein